jgi:hypothetical protein
MKFHILNPNPLSRVYMKFAEITNI